MAPTDQLQEVKIMLHGTAASEGIGIGKVMLIEEHSLEYTPRTVTDTEAESQRFKAAVDAFCYNTEKQAENLRSSAGEKEAEILAGHIQIIKDPYLSGEIEKLIADGQCAESALEHMCDMFIAMFSAADDELTKQRAADVRDIKSGVLGILLLVTIQLLRPYLVVSLILLLILEALIIMMRLFRLLWLASFVLCWY